MICLLIILPFSGKYLIDSSLFNKEQTLALSGLMKSGAVDWDEYGIPHISAKNERDANFILGFAMASQRLFQMDILRRVGRGQLSEVFGKKALSVDKTFRTLSFDRHTSNLLKNKVIDPKVLQAMDSFYQGVNSYIKEGKLPIEYKLLGIEPRAFDKYDGFAILGYMAYSFAMGFKTDSLFQELSQKLNHEKMNKLRAFPQEKRREKMVDSLNRSSGRNIWREAQAFLESSIGLFSGSNAWVLSGERSKSGKPLLASDPHVSISLPGLWYEAHIEQESLDSGIYGHFVPGLPFAALGHNRFLGWGVTISYVDDLDFFFEKEANLKKVEHRILVKGQDAVSFNVFISPRGPLVQGILGMEQAISMQWGHLRDDNRAAESFYLMGKAKGRDDFKKALSLGASPGLNIVYADGEGNIGRYLYGTQYKRNKNNYGDIFYHGMTREDSFLEVIDFESRSHIENPVTGLIVSANQKPEGFPASGPGYFQPYDRYATINAILNGKEKWSSEELKGVQNSFVNIYYPKYLKDFTSLLETKELNQTERKALSYLKQWDGISNAESIGAGIFHELLLNLELALLSKDLSMEQVAKYCETTASGHYFAKQFILKEHHKTIEKVFSEVVVKLTDNFGNLDNVKWGEMHLLTFPHPLGKGGKLLSWFFDLGPFPIGGGYNQVNNLRRVGCENGFQVKAGPSTRILLDMKNLENSFGVLPTGNDGNKGSLHFQDQWDLYKSGEYRNQIFNRKLSKDDIVATTSFNPK